MIYDELYELGKKRAKHVIWIMSDLQQKKYDNAKKCLDICMEDYELLGRPAEMIWYLGDATESADLPEVERMAQMQEDMFGALDVPLCYATGNHDYDYAEYCHKRGISEYRIPFFERVQAHPGWHTAADTEHTWFKVGLDGWMFYFFCDHAAKDNSWCSTHNGIRFGVENYPYTEEHFASIRRDMEACDKSIITAAHCAFPGGNRDTKFLGMIQPLPLNVRAHFYGHSHIGEYMCPRERIFSQIQWVDWQDIPQIDVASFENIRGTYCRSVILQLYEDNTMGVFFRVHDTHSFSSAFFPAKTSMEKPGDYERREILAKPTWMVTPNWQKP